jgi:hypothetical protein
MPSLTDSSVDLFSNLWDWRESNEAPFEQTLTTRASCLQAASLAASLLSGLVQSQPFFLGPCVPHVIAPALIQVLVSRSSLSEQAIFMEALQKLLIHVPGKMTQLDPGQSVMPVVKSLLESWSEGLVLSTASLCSDATEAMTEEASRWLTALISLTTNYYEAIPEELKAHNADALVPCLSKACSAADSMISALPPGHPFQIHLLSFQASTCSLLVHLLESWVHADRLCPSVLILILNLSHLSAAHGCLVKVLGCFFEPGEAMKGLLSQLEARGFKPTVRTARPRQEEAGRANVHPGALPEVVVIDDVEDAMVIEERPLGALASNNATATQPKKRMRQTQISFGDGKNLSTQPLTNPPPASKQSSGQKGKKRAGSKAATPPSRPPASIPNQGAAPPESSPLATLSSPDANGPSLFAQVEHRMITTDVSASAEALVEWLISLHASTSYEHSSRQSLLSVACVLDALQSVYNKASAEISCTCQCCALSPLFDLLSSVLLSWANAASLQSNLRDQVLQLIDSFTRLQVDRIAAKKSSCDCSPGCISGETEANKKVLSDLMLSAQLLASTSSTPGLLNVSLKILTLALPSSPLSLPQASSNDLVFTCIGPILNSFNTSNDGSLSVTRNRESFISTCQAAVNELQSRLADHGSQAALIPDAALILSSILRMTGSFSLHEIAQAVQCLTSKSSYSGTLWTFPEDEQKEGSELMGPLVSPPLLSFAPLLEVLLSKCVKGSPQPLPTEMERAFLSLFHAISGYLGRSYAVDLAGSGPILRRLLTDLLGSPQRLLQRLASLTLLPCILYPAPLYEAFGSAEDRSLASAEKRLLESLRAKLDEDDREMSLASNRSLSRAILDALTVSVESGRLRSGSRIEAMLMAVGCLGATQPTVREAAASALTRICTRFAAPMRGHDALRHALLKSSASTRVLEFVGR